MKELQRSVVKTFIQKNHYRLFVLFLCIIIAASFLLPELTSAVITQIKIDSIGHFISFFCLSIVLNALFKFPLAITVVCLVFYAILSEIGQYSLGFRHGEIRDVFADITGIILYLVLKYFYFIYQKSKTS